MNSKFLNHLDQLSRLICWNSATPVLEIQDILGIVSTENDMGSLPSFFLKPQGYGHYTSVIKSNIKRVVPDRFQKFSTMLTSSYSARFSAFDIEPFRIFRANSFPVGL